MITRLANFWAITLAFLLISPATALQVGQRPDLNFQTITGRKITTDALAGRLILLDFWATWCGPCVTAMPHMKQLHEKYQDRGVEIIGISLDRTKSKLVRFLEKEQIQWPQHCDGKGWNGALTRQFNVRGIPSVFLLSPDGTVLWTGAPSQLDQPLEEALRRHPPRQAGSPGISQESHDSAIELLQEARQAMDEAQYSLLLEKLSSLPQPVFNDRRLRGSLHMLAKKINVQVPDRDELNDAISGNPKGAERLSTILKLTDSTPRPVNADEPKMPPVHPGVVAHKLARAEKYRKDSKHFRAYKAYRWLIKRAADSDQGQIAAQYVNEYENDDMFMSELNERQIVEHARELLTLGQNYEQAKKPELARTTYKQLLDKYPRAEQCSEAKAALQDLDRHS